MLTVKIVELGKEVVEIAFENAVTVSEVLEIAGKEIQEVKINGIDVTGSTVLTSDTTIFLGAKKVKGNADYIEVKFFQFGAAGVNTVAVEPGTTIKDAADQIGKNFDGFDYKLSNSTSTVDGDTKLYEDTKVFLAKKTKGNADYIEVKFFQFGAAGVNTVAVEPGTTIKDAADQIGKNFDGFDYKLSNSTSTVDGDTKLYEDTKVFLAKKTKGNN